MERTETVIAPRNSWNLVDFGELFRYRELLYILVWRNVKVKYKQSVLGVAWVALQPLATMAVFTIIFGILARLPSDGVPYSIFVLLGLVPWGCFSNTFSNATNSIVAESRIIGKIYFPRLLIPLAESLSLLVDAVVSLAVLLVAMLLYGMLPTAKALLAPALLVLTVVAALGPGLFFAALNVKYRDVRYTLPFLIQIWTYATPVVFPVSLVPEKYRWILYANPMAGVVESFRACFIPGKVLEPSLLAISAAVGLVMFLVGVYYFVSVERTFADNI